LDALPPNEKRSKPAGEWNHYRVECRDGRVSLAVNGKVVSGASECTPRKGYIVLESEGSPVTFRNLRIQELPGANATPAESAAPAEAFRPLYTGIDLAGWKRDAGHDGHWVPSDWVLRYDGKSTAADPSLWSVEEFGDLRLICDWRLTAAPVESDLPVVLANGDPALDADGKQIVERLPYAGDSGIYLRGSSKSQVNIWCWPIGSGEVYGYRTDPAQPPDIRKGVTPRVRADRPLGEWNRFEIMMRGDELTVDLNGQRVLERARLPGVAERGPIALQHHGDPVEFASVLVKELGVYQSRSIEIEKPDGTKETYRYRLLEPDFVEPGKEYPLVVFLHGAGERGSDNERQLTYLPRWLAARAMRDAYPAYVLAPQCADDQRWWEVDWAAKESTPAGPEPSLMMRGAIRALEATVANHAVDRRRIYLTGLSMGGYGTWDLAARHPDWFAAAAPICGGGDERQAKRLASLPIWSFHGDADGVVPVTRTRAMVQAIRAAGGEPRSTELVGVGHDAWTPAYDKKSGLLAWLFAQKRETPAVIGE
jgi:dienelactone hydrolase